MAYDFDVTTDVTIGVENMPYTKRPGCYFRRGKGCRWWWKVRLPGEKRAKSRPLTPCGEMYATRDRSRAVAVANRLWREAEGRNPEGIEPLIAEWGSVLFARVSTSQRAHHLAVLRAFCLAHDIRGPEDITASDIDAYLSALAQDVRNEKGKVIRKGRSAQTLRHHRYSISKFCRWLVNIKGELEANPAMAVELPPVPKRRPRFLADSESAEVLRRARAALPMRQMLPKVALGLYTGARLESLLNLRWEQVQREAVIIEMSKVGDWCVVPLSAPLRAALAVLPRGAPADRLFAYRRSDTNVSWFREMVKGISSFGSGKYWHLLRSTWAVNMARGRNELHRPLTPWELMARGGWKSLDMVMRYVNIARAVGRMR